MSTTDNTSVHTEATTVENTAGDNFSAVWLNATLLGIEEVHQQLKNDPSFQHENIQKTADMLAHRIETIRTTPDTLTIMETLQAANLAKEGAFNADPAKITEAQAILS